MSNIEHRRRSRYSNSNPILYTDDINLSNGRSYLRSGTNRNMCDNSPSQNRTERYHDQINVYDHGNVEEEEEEEDVEPPVLSSYAMSLLEHVNEENSKNDENKENYYMGESQYETKKKTDFTTMNSIYRSSNSNTNSLKFQNGSSDTLERTSFSATISSRMGTTRAPLRLMSRFGLGLGAPKRLAASSDDENNDEQDQNNINDKYHNHENEIQNVPILASKNNTYNNYETDEKSKYSNTNLFGHSLKTASTTYDFESMNGNDKISCSPRVKRNNTNERPYDIDPTKRKLLLNEATVQNQQVTLTPKRNNQQYFATTPMGNTNNSNNNPIYDTPEVARRTLTPLSQKRTSVIESPFKLQATHNDTKKLRYTPVNNYQNNNQLQSVHDSPYFKMMLEKELRKQRESILEEVRREKVESFKVRLNDEQPSTDGDKSDKKLIQVNSQWFEIIEQIGKGGSSKVFRTKIAGGGGRKSYAIKVVTFDEYDDSTIEGFRGEIDILRKFKQEERVVRLIDHSVDHTSIKLVMECGEIDLAHVLINRNDKPLDVGFIRFHSLEMIRCVYAVHRQGVIHSDLKPANFLFVKGMLKLIDFGISNSLSDHTVNVYRDSQIGTPNYMAPETLIETNQTLKINKAYTNEENSNSTWKVGKPSDIWSCGCIIYQMVYGKPPYAIYPANQRLSAIIDPKIEIKYPEMTSNGDRVLESLIDLMKKCLVRDPKVRLTVEEVMSHDFFKPTSVTYKQLSNIVKNSIDYGSRNPNVSLNAPKIKRLVNEAWEAIREDR